MKTEIQAQFVSASSYNFMNDNNERVMGTKVNVLIDGEARDGFIGLQSVSFSHSDPRFIEEFQPQYVNKMITLITEESTKARGGKLVKDIKLVGIKPSK